jgi:circadian clock protein KaiB
MTISRNKNEKIEMPGKYIFKLFISSKSTDSVYAIKNIQKFCRHYLPDKYELEIIDIFQEPDKAINEKIVLTPLLIKKFPLPEERISGDLSNTQNILTKFDID